MGRKLQIEVLGDLRGHIFGECKPARGVKGEKIVHRLGDDETRLARAGRRNLTLEKTPDVGRRGSRLGA